MTILFKGCDRISKYTNEDLKTMQNWPLERKIQVTQLRIMEWYERWEGNVYISFSGGKDSTVLLDLARRIYPYLDAVFVDTGLEYPEIREFVKSKENVQWIHPEIKFGDVIEKYGYPVVSKNIAKRIDLWQRGDREKWLVKAMNNEHSFSSFNIGKWKFLENAPFKISNKCCDIMKKRPLQKLKKKPIVGTMASESSQRALEYKKSGCNSFDGKHPQSKPMGFWTEQDVLRYLNETKIPYASIYGEIQNDDGKLSLTGLERTGCMFCMFGCHLEDEPNRFQRMKLTHPKQYDYCIRPTEENGLGIGKCLDYIGVKYK